MGIKETFCQRINGELQSFKEELLKENGDAIYGSSYKIEVFEGLHEILLGLSYETAGEAMGNMLQEDSAVLETLYQGLLKYEDGFYGELKDYTSSVLADNEI